jgi:hypothetical protein
MPSLIDAGLMRDELVRRSAIRNLKTNGLAVAIAELFFIYI